MGVLKSVEPTGFLAFAPAFAERTGRMWIGGSSKIARTAEEEFCLRPPVWFRLCRLRGKLMPSNQRIEDYALIGDCTSAALVARNRSIDWLCWPRFDFGACFASLLGEPEHGRWLIAPTDSDARIERRYLDGSLILVTLFETSDGAVELVDFMPPHTHACDLVRLVRGLRGCVAMCTEFILRFDYGAVVPWVERLPEGGVSAIGGPERVVLRTPLPLRGEDLKNVWEFTVGAGEAIPFILSYGPSFQPRPRPIDAERAPCGQWPVW